MKQTLFDKVWDSHVVRSIEHGPDVLFIDRHMVHEVTSPVAFLGLKNRQLPVLYPERTFATADHNTQQLTNTYLWLIPFQEINSRRWKKMPMPTEFPIGV